MNKVSVVIRNKNQEKSLEFLLKNLTERYSEDIEEIIVLDNLSSDRSKEICDTYGVNFISLKDFSYGGSANIAAESARQDVVVIFSAHAYPVSHDFFKQILLQFNLNKNLAGVRCLHNPNDFRNYINGISSKTDPNKSGLIFCGSAFNKNVWKKHKFKDDIRTFEDKEWTLRVLKNGFDIEFSPSIFCYEIKRSKEELFFRYKNEVIGGYQLWHQEVSLLSALKGFGGSFLGIFNFFFIEHYYNLKKLKFLIMFNRSKPEKIKY